MREKRTHDGAGLPLTSHACSPQVTIITRYHTDKVCIVKAMVFPVVMYICETIKKAEH